MAPQLLLDTPTYLVSVELIATRWPRLRRLLESEFPPEVTIEVIFDKMVRKLQQLEQTPRTVPSPSEAALIQTLESEVALLKSDIVAMNRMQLRL